MIYEEGVYDVTSFLHEHPGGESILLKHAGDDITKPFKEIGHTEKAHALLKKYFIGALGEVLTQQNEIKQQVKLNFLTKVKTRLFTKEDKFGLHKLFGVICLIGLAAAVIRVFQPLNEVTPFFAKPSFMNITLLLSHAGLALSALMFHIPLKRHFNHIKTLEHQEQRLHSIIFSLRSIGFVFLYMMVPINPSLWMVRALFLSFWHSLADLVTRKFSGLNSTTIRGSSNGSEIEKFGVSFASIAQLGAILVLLGFSVTDELHRQNLADLCYLTLLPIQLAVFQLTLKRKGFLNAKINGWLYTGELAFLFVALPPGSRELFLIILYGILRFIFRINKYVLFFLFAFLAQNFTFVIPQWVPLSLGMLLFIYMREKSQTQGFKNSATVKCLVMEKTELQENIYLLKLQTPKGFIYEMPAGRHLALNIDEKTQRFYTPISSSSNGRSFEILAKTYPTGKANELLSVTKRGDYLEFEGPFGDAFYSKNKCLRHGEELIPLKQKQLLCIAGGSGITPIYAILEKIHSKVNVELIYINRTKNDILLADKIKKMPTNITVTLYLTNQQNHEPWFNQERYHPDKTLADVVLISGPSAFCEFYTNIFNAFMPSNKIIVF